MTGFKTKSLGTFIFKQLWEFLADNECDEPEVSSTKWKMKFTLKEEVEKLDSEDEDEPA